MKRILVIDDQPDLRRLARWSLELLPWPAQTLEACSADEGLLLARSGPPDLVLLDVSMPGTMDGYELCRVMRATPELAKARIVLLSANGQVSDVQTGMEAGADAYLVKPFSPQRLLATAERLLSSSDSRPIVHQQEQP